MTFVDYDGSTLKEQTVEEGGSAAPPDAPNRNGFRFTGWSGDYKNVTGSRTITAQYEEIAETTYTVTFKDYDGTELKSESVASGKSATPPTNPSKAGAEFLGWNGVYANVTSDCSVTAVYNDSRNVLMVPTVSGAVGSNVTVMISVCGDVKTCGFDINIMYDPDLTLVSYDADQDLDVVVNTEAYQNGIALNYSGATDKTKSRDVIELTFSVESTTKQALPITISVNSIKEISGNDPADSAYAIVNGVVNVN